MEQEKLKELILKHFDNKNHRIISFWYDPNGENENILDSLSFDNIKVHKLNGRNNLYTKILLEHTDTTSNYLIYSKKEKPEPQKNWFLDTQFYTKEFSVDEVANLCNEFEIFDNESKLIFKNHLKFFNNKDRKKSFKNLLKSKTPENIYLAMLATLVEGTLLDIDKVIQRYIINTIIKKEDVLKEFEKYGLNEKFWELVHKKFGYSGERDPKLLLASIIFRKLKQQLSAANFPETYKKYTCANTAEVECNLFLENWFRDNRLVDYYKQISNEIEKDFKIAENITDWTDIIRENPEFQVLEIFDKSLISYFVNSFETLKCDDKKIIDKRKDTLFYEKYKSIYEAIYWAIELNNLVRNTNIPDQKPKEFIKNYASNYYRIDKAYRKFYYYCQLSNNRYLDRVRDIVEKAYVNNFLDTSCSKFSKQINELSPIWKIEDLPMQKDFYYNKIKNEKLKTVVIISDALRYEVAQDLMQNIKNNYQIKAQTDLDFMVGSLPSYTKLGKAALLPHTDLTMNDKGEIFADGISTVSSENRGKILKSAKPNSVVLDFEDFNKKPPKELKEIFSGLDVAYVYHDKIDSTGESNEEDVFDAVEKSINEITEKIKFIFNNTLAGNVIITSDHGFLYQYSDLEERQKITIGSLPAIEKSKRYILDNNPIKEQGVMNFDMSYILKDSKLVVSTPLNINRFKTQGGGINYVHGGASPQEIVVPVLTVKQDRKQEINKVDVILENSTRKITNNKFTLSFLQKQPISEYYKPRKLTVYMYDEQTDTKISNEIDIVANVPSDNMEDRIFKKTLELKNFEHDKNKDYYLIVKDVDEVGEPYQKYAFTINLVFTNDFDF